MKSFRTRRIGRLSNGTLSGIEHATAACARHLGTLLGVLAVLAGCTPTLQALPVDPAVDFSAHAAHRGLVIDEMPGVASAVLVPGGWQALSGGPRFLLQAHDKTVAAFWLPAPGRMIVRQSSDAGSPLIGEVDASWPHGAIRLTVKPASGARFETGAFDRIDGRIVTAALSSQAQNILDVRGTYRAEVHDATGAPVGWLRAAISPHQAAAHIYDGVLPPELNGPLATAAVALLDAEVNSIEDHAFNVYLGN